MLRNRNLRVDKRFGDRAANNRKNEREADKQTEIKKERKK